MADKSEQERLEDLDVKSEEECLEDLANAIVERAVKDYVGAVRKLKKKPKSTCARKTIVECEAFFRSDWYKLLTDYDPDALIGKLWRDAIE